MWTRSAAAVAAVAAVMTLPARSAQSQQWYQLCAGGGPTSCAAVRVALTDGGGGTTRVAVRAQNLQGTFAGSTGRSVLDQLYLNFSRPVGSGDGLTDDPLAGPGVTSYLGTGDLAGTTPGPWSYFLDGGTVSLFADNPGLGHFTDILGCSGPSPLEDPGYRTCGGRGLRWVELGFTLAGTFGEGDISSLGFGTGYGDLALLRHGCNDGPNATSACRVTRFTPQVVPEPTTVALLAGGLAGLGALGARARRRTA